MKKIKNIDIILALCALSVSVLSGCTEEILGPDPIGDGESIVFKVGEPDTRTAYTVDNKLNPTNQIVWENGDEIQIFCNEAYGTEEEKQATYAVNQSLVTPVDKEKVLRWGYESEEHNFYAVYPDGVATVTDGIASFNVNINNQVSETDGMKYGSDATGYTYTAHPSMENAYMVASRTVDRGKNVQLPFKPIMTTLRLTVQSPKFGESLSDYLSDEKQLTFKGLDIILNSSVDQDTGFSYNIKENTLTQNGIKAVKVRINNTAEGTDFIKLTTTREIVSENWSVHYSDPTYEYVKLTAFLPPVEISKENPVAIKIGDQTLVLKPNTPIPAGAIAEIKLPALEAGDYGEVEFEYSTWMSYLAEYGLINANTKVSEMSIPGAHYAASTSSTIGSNNNPAQSQTIANLWNQGIRCFDLAADAYNDSWKQSTVNYTYTGTTITGTVQHQDINYETHNRITYPVSLGEVQTFESKKMGVLTESDPLTDSFIDVNDALSLYQEDRLLSGSDLKATLQTIMGFVSENEFALALLRYEDVNDCMIADTPDGDGSIVGSGEYWEEVNARQYQQLPDEDVQLWTWDNGWYGLGARWIKGDSVKRKVAEAIGAFWSLNQWEVITTTTDKKRTKNNKQQTFNEKLNALINELGSDKIVVWNAALTYGDCKGKVVIMSPSDWPTSADNTSGSIGGTSIYVQNYSSYSSVEDKVSAINAAFSAYTAGTWMINCFSGAVSDIQNASSIYNHNSKALLENLKTKTTPAGIVLFDAADTDYVHAVIDINAK